MVRNDIIELRRKIDEISKPHRLLSGRAESPQLYNTRILYLKTLYDKLHRQLRQTQYDEIFCLELSKYRPPNILSKILHLLGIHHWLNYEEYSEHSNYWLRICTICGKREWTIYNRKYNYYKNANIGTELDINDLNKFIEKELL